MKQKSKKKFISITAIILMIAAIFLYIISMDEEESPELQQLENTEVPIK